MEKGFNDERYFKTQCEFAPVGIARVNLKGETTYANEKFCEYFGYSKSEMIGISFKSITDPRDIEAEEEMFAHILLDQIDYYTMHKRYITKMGNGFWAEVHMYGIKDKTKRTCEVICWVMPLPVNKESYTVEKQGGKPILRPSLDVAAFIKDNKKTINKWGLWIVIIVSAILMVAGDLVIDKIKWMISIFTND